MATSVSAMLHILAQGRLTMDAPYSGDVVADLDNNTGGRRWTQGTGSGQVDRIYEKAGTLGAGATDTLNLLAAGSLKDAASQAIDADELKALVLKCNTGTITFEAPGANGLSLFKAASDGIVLTAGQTIGLDLGAAGIDVTTNSQFSIDDSGGAGATYSLWLIVAQ